MKTNPAFALMIEENHEKTSVRLVGTGIWTRDLPNASLVRYHGATSLGEGAIAGVFNLSSSRANLHLSYNPAGRSRYRLQNLHGYIKHNYWGIGGSPGDVGEVPMS